MPIRVLITDDATRREVRDDGCGFDPGAVGGGGVGLRGMRERVQGIGGTLRVESKAGRGTAIRVEVPRTRAAG